MPTSNLGDGQSQTGKFSLSPLHVPTVQYKIPAGGAGS